MSELRKYDYIDAMRGIAVLLVILIHVGSEPLVGRTIANAVHYAQMGVQLFFVASALTLCLSYASRKDEPHPYASFLIRRFFRIAPLYYVGILLYTVLHFSFPGVDTHVTDVAATYSPQHILANVLFVHGLVPAANNNIVPGGWSIGTEMLFYLLFPVLFRLLSGLDVLALAIITLLYAAIVLPAIAAMAPDAISINTFLYFNILTQIPAFLCGFILWKWLQRQSPTAMPIAGTILMVVGTVAGVLVWHVHGMWYQQRSAPPIAISLTALALPLVFAVAFLGLGLVLKRIAVMPVWLVSIGRASYSMYIFHFIMAWFICPGLDPYLHDHLPAALRLCLYFALSVAATYLVAQQTLVWIEKPGIAWGNRIIAQRLQSPAATRSA